MCQVPKDVRIDTFSSESDIASACPRGQAQRLLLALPFHRGAHRRAPSDTHAFIRSTQGREALHVCFSFWVSCRVEVRVEWADRKELGFQNGVVGDKAVKR